MFFVKFVYVLPSIVRLMSISATILKPKKNVTSRIFSGSALWPLVLLGNKEILVFFMQNTILNTLDFIDFIEQQAVISVPVRVHYP